ncbi:SDR family NAD(P)-dependent oxidoreductase [Celeribacter indicus]|uniref:Short-chain dehydrogenase/reductase SDR n=1 Tax=Celeribacter indicus TaxID=1208324 RepID=A0A0B5E1T6_9RHOB|nr:SDR family oxidoreductase [Celeribacter indicus]AJE49166.1 short-chain dehydrogenase/reductase SDR [Celeribacter indicus]AJE49194.1 short-chain dehydrogenase/reductase SDR [Celeribacter indicus]SDX17960.1 Short-chain dehydrogenase [Celeribacter indicus]SDX18539.1 Short-chain dehydrogenase [Celeribacter indicus]
MAEGQIVVTGASKGIGAAIAAELEGRGHPVVCLSRSGRGPAGRQIACDMTEEAAVAAAFAAIAAEGPVAGLVNNAGVHIGGPIAALSVESFEETMALNATAVMVAAREAYPHLRAGGGGTIVNIGSFFDKLGVPDNLAYCASKAAVAAMTRCMAVEWARDGIRALTVAPGYIETDLNRDYLAREKVRAWMRSRIPTGAPGRPEDVARLVAALFGEDIGFLTGETIYIDGAQGMNH